MKKFLCVFMSIIMLGLTLAVIPASAADAAISFLGVEAVAGNSKTAVNWWYNSGDGKYYLFLPSDADFGSLTVNMAGTDRFTVNGKTVQNGETTDVFAGGGTFTVTSGGYSYTLVVMKSASIPSVYIQTKSGSLDAIHADKNNKESGTITVVENGEVTVDNKELKSIKGRGNTTWIAPKKPYNIKFDKKTDLFGMGKAKKWSLLANYYDPSMIRNMIVMGAALELELPCSSEYQPVDLYINGDYLGNYLVCESVEIGENRVDINNLEDANEQANPEIDVEQCAPAGNGANGAVPSTLTAGARKWVNIPNEPKEITGGYLLEVEYDWRVLEEVSGFTTNIGQAVTVKSPEYASKAQVNYIADYWQEMEDAVYSETGYNSLGKYYTDYFDMDSLTSMYILQEYIISLDSGLTSCFFFKNAGDDKIYSGPAWDFDYCLANSFNPGNVNKVGINLLDPTVWFANALFYGRDVSAHEIPVIFSALYKHEDFRQAVSEKWNEVSSLFGDGKVHQITEYRDMLSASAVMNAIRWNLLSGQDADSKQSSYAGEINTILNFIPARTAALNKGFASNAAMLYYDANGGKGCVSNDQILSVGDTVTLKAISFGVGIDPPSTTLAFTGWNTKPDGSGRQYNAGDSIKLTQKTTVLYAQWASTSKCSHICHKGGFLGFLWNIANFFNRLFRINRYCSCGAKHW